MVFHPKEKRIPNDVVLSFNNIPELIHPIERISNKSKIQAFKILGVYLDENLSFDYHFKYLFSKISRSLYYLNIAKHLLPTVALLNLFIMLFFILFL